MLLDKRQFYAQADLDKRRNETEEPAMRKSKTDVPAQVSFLCLCMRAYPLQVTSKLNKSGMRTENFSLRLAALKGAQLTQWNTSFAYLSP